MGTTPPSDVESDRPIRRSGGPKPSVPRSRLASRVDRALRSAIAGEPHVAVSAKVSELLGEAGPVSSTIRAALTSAGPSLSVQLRVTEAFRAGGLVDELLNSLVHPDPEIRIAAAQLCGALRLTDAVPWLDDLLRDPSLKVRGAAMRALGQLGGRRAVEVLISAVDRFPQARLAIELSRAASDIDIEALLRQPVSVQAAVVAVLACGLRKDRLRVPALVGIANDLRWPTEVRAAACRALAIMDDPSSTAVLSRLIDDPHAEVRAAAAKAHHRSRSAGQGGPG